MPKFQDKAFPPTLASLGDLSAVKDGYFTFDQIQWVPVAEVCKSHANDSPELFVDGVSPNDIAQGMIGNCWLLSAFASVARVMPNIIEKRFTSPLDRTTGKTTLSKDGHYVIQLWDYQLDRWLNIEIDDMIPVIVEDGRQSPLSAKPQGCEAWVLLLEKAFAKYMGSYANMEGGFMGAAFRCLVGPGAKMITYKTDKAGGVWEPHKYIIGRIKGRRGRYILGAKLAADVEKPKSAVTMFGDLCKQILQDMDSTFIIAAGTTGDDDTQKCQGIVQGHAYGVVDMAMPTGFTMIKLANPWGRGEWTGEWSDGDGRWEENPEVAKLCGYAGKQEDGMFWMQLQSFEQHYRTLDIVRLSVARHFAAGADFRCAMDSSTSDVAADRGHFIWSDDEEDSFEDDNDVAGKDQDGPAAEEDEDEETLEEVFRKYDSDGSGTLNKWELAMALNSAAAGKVIPTAADMDFLFELVDVGETGATFKQFEELEKVLPAYFVFKVMDTTGEGLSTARVLDLIKELTSDETRGMSAVEKKKMERRMKGLLATFDDDGSGHYDLREFLELFLHLEETEA